MSAVLSLWEKLTENKYRIYLFGYFISFLIVLKEVSRLTHNNFQIFSYGSLDFWAESTPTLTGTIYPSCENLLTYFFMARSFLFYLLLSPFSLKCSDLSYGIYLLILSFFFLSSLSPINSIFQIKNLYSFSQH